MESVVYPSKTFEIIIDSRDGRIKISEEYVFNNLLKKNNTLSSFAIDPSTKLIEKMNSFVKNITLVARVDQYWYEYSNSCHDMISDQMKKPMEKLHMFQRTIFIQL